jgi:hypothetical protein
VVESECEAANLKQVPALNPLDDIFPPTLANLADETFDIQRQHLFALHQELSRDGLELMKRKNQDYGNRTDPFKNFKKHGEMGILVRLDDKLNRLESFAEKGFLAVKSESIKDTVIDGMNYLVLFYAYLEMKGVLGNEH